MQVIALCIVEAENPQTRQNFGVLYALCDRLQAYDTGHLHKTADGGLVERIVQ